jgi:hypothetical protein
MGSARQSLSGAWPEVVARAPTTPEHTHDSLPTYELDTATTSDASATHDEEGAAAVTLDEKQYVSLTLRIEVLKLGETIDRRPVHLE